MSTIHDGEADISTALARALLREQLPEMADLPLHPIGATGTDHRMYRLGDRLLLRLPRRSGAADSLAHEVTVLRAVAEAVPVAVPAIVVHGSPAAHYPFGWAVYGWLPGQDGWAARHSVHDPHGDLLAQDLAAVVLALRAAPSLTAPHRSTGQRGGPLDGVLDRIEGWLRGAEGLLAGDDVARVRQTVRAAAGSADDSVPFVLSHGDLIPGNLLLDSGRLSAVIDWGYLSYADPALDLVPAWAVLGPGARATLRNAVGADSGTWARARLTAVEQALGQIVYYAPRRHPLAEVGRRTLEAVLSDR
ncbi:MAG: phosphotransferase [Phycicoccus sp.]